MKPSCFIPGIRCETVCLNCDLYLFEVVDSKWNIFLWSSKYWELLVDSGGWYGNLKSSGTAVFPNDNILAVVGDAMQLVAGVSICDIPIKYLMLATFFEKNGHIFCFF